MSAPTSSGRVEEAGPSPVWTTAAVARRLGVAASTLRGWSLRYGIGPLGHNARTHRRYTAADVAELDTMRHLVEQGIVVSTAAAIARHQRFTQPDTDGAGDVDDTGADGQVSVPEVHRLVAAARHLDGAAAAAIVATSLARCGVVTTWNQLCRPVLADLDNPVLDNPVLDNPVLANPMIANPETVDNRGAAGTAAAGDFVDAELLLSWAVTTSLRRLPTPPAQVGDLRVLLACCEGEQHTLALEALHAALGQRRVDAQMLGASVPASALRAAVETLRPAVVVVWAQVATTAAPTLLPARTEIVAAGPGWSHLRLDPAVAHPENMQEALTLACG